MTLARHPLFGWNPLVSTHSTIMPKHHLDKSQTNHNMAVRFSSRRMTLVAQLLCLLLVDLAWAESTRVTITRYQNGNPVEGVVGEGASWGWPMPAWEERVNVMFAPKQPNSTISSLCTYPETLKDLNSQEFASRINVYKSFPIALLVVSDGTCSEQEQARVATQIKSLLPIPIFYLIIYRDPKLNVTFNDFAEFKSIGIIYVSYNSGIAIENSITAEQQRTGMSPYLMSDDAIEVNNAMWFLAYGIQIQSDGRLENYDNFYWFRIILFILLFLSPCFRAAYLWYAGGGRFHWRRNEEGRITGIQYIPPMPYWLSSGLIPRPVEPTSRILTEEQFNELPVISYQPVDNTERSRDDDPTSSSADFADAEQPQPNDETESNSEPMQVTSNLRTTCNMCSICIDDFEAGELLIILPRCLHAFHKDCIHPWLRERQGCCPLCKTSVYDDASMNDENENEEEPSDGAQNDPDPPSVAPSADGQQPPTGR